MVLEQTWFLQEEMDQEILEKEKLEEMDNQKVVHQDYFQEKEMNLVEVDKEKFQKEVEEDMDNQEEVGQIQEKEMKVQEGLQEMDNTDFIFF